jgi:hypothetical protein
MPKRRHIRTLWHEPTNDKQENPAQWCRLPAPRSGASVAASICWYSWRRLDPYGIRGVLLEFDNGNTDVFTPRMHEEFKSYELQQMAVYIQTISRGLNNEPKRLA